MNGGMTTLLRRKRELEARARPRAQEYTRIMDQRRPLLRELEQMTMTYTQESPSVPEQQEDLFRRIASLDRHVTAILVEHQVDVTEYAQVTCRIICERMQQRLPVEIRFMIYGYMSTKSKIGILSYATESEAVSDAEEESSDEEPLPLDFDPVTFEEVHCWDPQFVGEQTLKELAANFFDLSHFVVELSNRAQPLREFLLTDPNHFDFLAWTYVSNISITFEEGEYDAQNPARKILAEALFTLKPQARINLDLRCEDFPRTWVESQKRIALTYLPLASRLRAAGYIVTVTIWKSRWGDKIIDPDDECSAEAWSKKIDAVWGVWKRQGS
ncbi:uncharacterized protein EI97DRAFT_454830 [Westerdykella ornata]|uniref:Uncharacterized protein n=1 Tax=Westerdykella ornata TaxID=318751 RepID=A0A6A6JTI8_WESOR|nr:uncharacterized protein EI97DRAFT_454830 [Westerdykella ornata]KAF2279882.1 hypothetical protein EI97DRAFT_454830 [Westerdykella ornata]